MRFFSKGKFKSSIRVLSLCCSEFFEFRKTEHNAKLQTSPLFDISSLLKNLDWFYIYFYIEMYSKIGAYNQGNADSVFSKSLKPLKAYSWKKNKKVSYVFSHCVSFRHSFSSSLRVVRLLFLFDTALILVGHNSDTVAYQILISTESVLPPHGKDYLNNVLDTR